MVNADLKEAFLDRYNCSRSNERAFRAGIVAASQHNPLYQKSAGNSDRAEVRTFWGEELMRICQDYLSVRSEGEYELDVLGLKAIMNERFADRFSVERHPRFACDPGFRVSHAQKSLSICLKHLWCLGAVETPPECPVDSVVLRRAGLKYPQTRWTRVNSIEEHRSMVATLKKRSDEAGLALAEWELREFLT